MRPGLPALLLVAAACGPGGGGEIVLPEGPDVAVYQAEVHPYVERRCATLDCHGDPGRPLRVYSELGLRAPGRDREIPLDAEELAANVASVAGVDPSATDPDHHRLVLEPLAPAAGGMEHVGGEVWLDRSDPGYVCLREWLAGRSPAGACETALNALPHHPDLP